MCFFFRFHFAKALFAKLKTKFGLAAFFRPGKQATHANMSLALRKYFCLPLLKPHDIRGAVLQLEDELKEIARHCTREVARKLNNFHNYVVQYWMRLQGSQTISVAGCDHKTNNCIKR